MKQLKHKILIGLYILAIIVKLLIYSESKDINSLISNIIIYTVALLMILYGTKDKDSQK